MVELSPQASRTDWEGSAQMLREFGVVVAVVLGDDSGGRSWSQW